MFIGEREGFCLQGELRDFFPRWEGERFFAQREGNICVYNYGEKQKLRLLLTSDVWISCNMIIDGSYLDGYICCLMGSRRFFFGERVLGEFCLRPG